MIEIEKTINSKTWQLFQEIPREYSIDGMVLKSTSRDITTESQYQTEISIGMLHYKENYLDTDPWLDIDDSYFTDEGDHYLYSKLPNLIKVFKNRCSYEIQNRDNRQNVITVELVSINGNDITYQIDDEEFRFYINIVANRVGIQKELKLDRTGNTIFKWKITHIGEGGMYSMTHREQVDAYDNFEMLSDEDGKNKIPVETIKTQINENSFYFEEIVPKEAKLVDTDSQITALVGSSYENDGEWSSSQFTNNNDWQSVRSSPDVRHGFTKYTGINIPKDSTITSATIRVCAYTNCSYPVSALIFANKLIDASVPTSINDAEGRASTTAQVVQAIPSMTTNSQQTSAELNTVVSEMVSMPNQYSGGPILFFLRRYTSSGTQPFRAYYSVEKDSSKSARLVVTFNEPTSAYKIQGISSFKSIFSIPALSIKRIHKI